MNILILDDDRIQTCYLFVGSWINHDSNHDFNTAVAQYYYLHNPQVYSSSASGPRELSWSCRKLERHGILHDFAWNQDTHVVRRGFHTAIII